MIKIIFTGLLAPLSLSFSFSLGLLFALSFISLGQLSCRQNITLEGQSYALNQLIPPKHGVAINDLWVRSDKYVLATDNHEASLAGAYMLEKGGNVIDAAIAVSFAISVLRPQSTGIGGGGFLIMHIKGKTVAFDFRERAPFKASRNMYIKKGDQKNGKVDRRASLFGGLAVATPGIVSGLTYIHKRYGHLPLNEVIAPAIQLAERGFKVYPNLEEAVADAYEDMGPAMRAIFAPGGKKIKSGDILLQSDLAGTLKLIARHGAKPFYQGTIGRDLVKAVRANGGLVTQADLRRYRTLEKAPLWGNYRGYRLATMPPPSSGVFLLAMLGMLEHFDLRRLYDEQKRSYLHLLTEVMRRGYRERALYGGDPRYYSLPLQKLLSQKQIKKNLSTITLKKATPSENLPENLLKDLPENLQEPRQTTHFSIIDSKGNAVASTQSINYRFGARFVVPGRGIILNDTMDDFSAAPGTPNAYGLIGGEANAIAAGKTALSSMSPTLVFDSQGVRLALGAMGGSYIITAILQTLINDLDLQFHPYVSVAHGRLHHQYLPDNLLLEEPAFKNRVKEELESMGHTVRLGKHWARLFLAKREAEREERELTAVSDPRGDGLPVGKTE